MKIVIVVKAYVDRSLTLKFGVKFSTYARKRENLRYKKLEFRILLKIKLEFARTTSPHPLLIVRNLKSFIHVIHTTI